MKKIFLLFLLSVTVCVVHAQKDKQAPYQKDSTLPVFSMLETDSTTWFNTSDIPGGKPTIIIYFNPDCGHCQLTAHEFMDKLKDFKDAFFIWVSYHVPLTEVKEFAVTYKMLKEPNIKIGKELKYTVVPFYNVQYTPYIAVYNEHGKLLQTFDGGTDPDTIIRLLHPATE